MSADYSQVELRILAHLCGDPGLREAFARGEDIHASTAAAIFGVPLAQVSPEQRRVAKAVNLDWPMARARTAWPRRPDWPCLKHKSS